MTLRLKILVLIVLALSVACNKASSRNPTGGSRVTVSDGAANALAGQWKGTMQTKDKHDGTMELTLNREGTQIKASARFYNDKVQSASPIRGLEIKDQEIKFFTNILGANVYFTGQVNGDKLRGTLEAVQRETTVDTGNWDLERRLQ
jgi:hypothetical protein